MYWFYRLKKIVEIPYEYMEGVFLDSENIEQNTFTAGNRDEAKKYLHNKFGKLPLRKPKDCEVGDTYLYLVQSSEYWYKRDHEEINIVCEFCENGHMFIGSKNIVQDKRGIYCSKECQIANNNKYKEEDEWICHEDHLNISGYEKEHLVGYIYKITNKNNMKGYVGQTINPVIFRWWQHLKVESKFEQVNLSDLVFEVLEVVTYDKSDEFDNVNYSDAKDKLNKRESHYIQLFDCIENGYNQKIL